MVAVEHLDVGEKMVGEVDRLGALEMGVAGDDDRVVGRAEVHERALERPDLVEQRDDLVPQPETDIEGHLVVAGTSGVEFRAGRDAPGQLGLDVHVDVLKLGLPRESARLDLGADGGEPGLDGLQLGRRQDADRAQHGGVRDGATDVVTPKPPIKADGFGEGGDIGGRTTEEAAGTGDDGRRRALGHIGTGRDGAMTTAPAEGRSRFGRIGRPEFPDCLAYRRKLVSRPADNRPVAR